MPKGVLHIMAVSPLSFLREKRMENQSRSLSRRAFSPAAAFCFEDGFRHTLYPIHSVLPFCCALAAPACALPLAPF